MDSTALIVVDFQNDFIDGSLAVPEAETIITRINSLKTKFSTVVLSKDWHPPNHASFKENGGRWPKHCVQGSNGAKLHPKLVVKETDYVVVKGTHKEFDSYSAFYNKPNDETPLNSVLKDKKIKTIFVCGLAAEHCVHATAMHTLRLGYKCYIVLDCIKGLDQSEIDKCHQKFIGEGGYIIDDINGCDK